MGQSEQLPDDVWETLRYIAVRLWNRWTRSDPSGGEGNKPGPDRPDRSFVHFMPGHAVILAEHVELPFNGIQTRTQEELKKLLRAGIPQPLEKPVSSLIDAVGRLRQTDAIAQSPILTVPRPQNRQGSLIFVDDLQDLSEPETIRLCDFFNRQIATDQAKPGDLVLKVVSPDWLSTGSPVSGTGGPGARPIPAPGVDPAHEPWKFTFEGLAAALLANGGEGVEVAILDTAPPWQDIEAAYAKWQDQHPLLRSMLGPDGRFDVDGMLRVTYLDHKPAGWDTYQIAGHDYVMSDHGLFVAGIINSIAPRAKLHLIEVLNPYGVGALQSIARGLLIALQRSSMPRLVINCSLTLQIPLLGQPKAGLKWDLLSTDCELMKLMGLPLQWICDAVQDQGKRVVAAAGNDAVHGNRPQARYPAAYDSVIGVGALKPDATPADYSNLSDTPLNTGIATFGGQSCGTSSHSNALPGVSVLGTYIGTFPDPGPAGTRSRNGWGWWAGTSFATPVITGTLAALLSKTGDVKLAEDELRKAVGQVTSGPIGGVFPVKQG